MHLKIENTKPSNSLVNSPKPNNSFIVNPKPSNNNYLKDQYVDQLYAMTLRRGSPMGLLLSLTYKEDIAVISSKSP